MDLPYTFLIYIPRESNIDLLVKWTKRFVHLPFWKWGLEGVRYLWSRNCQLQKLFVVHSPLHNR